MIWEFADVLGRRLVAWGVLSLVLGTVAIAAGDTFWQGLGWMFAGFGLVDGAIGVLARRLADRGRRRTIGDHAARARETRRIRRILLLNAALDVLYIAGGAWLAASAGGDAWRAGAGLGIVIQGAFLLAFDLLHARWVPSPEPILPEDIPLFAGPRHDPFRLSLADDSAPRTRGALLVHGLTGTPREMRALAAVLAANGLVVDVPLLPGHGAEIRDIADYRLEDWLACVETAAAGLRATGLQEIVVVGHSLGGSLALATAARVRPDALVLLAPFWWPTPAWQRVLGPLFRVFLPPGFRIFARLDPATPEVRAGLESLLPGMDLDDPAVAAGLRDLRVPTSLFEQLFRASRAAELAAPGIRVPVLVVQGLRDTVSRPDRTHALLARFATPPGPPETPGTPTQLTQPMRPRLLEVDAAHDLVSEESPVGDEVLAAVLAFVREVGRA